MYVIVKMIKNIRGKEMPVVLIDSQGEVLEFSDVDKAEYYRELFEKNSDSGYKYLVRKIG